MSNNQPTLIAQSQSKIKSPVQMGHDRPTNHGLGWIMDNFINEIFIKLMNKNPESCLYKEKKSFPDSFTLFLHCVPHCAIAQE